MIVYEVLHHVRPYVGVACRKQLTGLATKHGIGMPNSPGTVDSDYRGEMKVPLVNLGRAAFTVEHGMRIAQMVVAPVARATVRVVEELDGTSRGAGGFGSTGN